MSRKNRERQQAIGISKDPNQPIRQQVSGAKGKPKKERFHLSSPYRSGSRRPDAEASTNLGGLLKEALGQSSDFVLDWIAKVNE